MFMDHLLLSDFYNVVHMTFVHLSIIMEVNILNDLVNIVALRSVVVNTSMEENNMPM